MVFKLLSLRSSWGFSEVEGNEAEPILGPVAESAMIDVRGFWVQKCGMYALAPGAFVLTPQVKKL